jgi:hypothetical protein
VLAWDVRAGEFGCVKQAAARIGSSATQIERRFASSPDIVVRLSLCRAATLSRLPAPRHFRQQVRTHIASEAGRDDLLLRFDHGARCVISRRPVSISLWFQCVDDRLGICDPGVGVGLLDLLAAECLDLR